MTTRRVLRATLPPGIALALVVLLLLLRSLIAPTWGDRLTCTVETNRATYAGALTLPRGGPYVIGIQAVDDEVFVNCQYGYDIRCELVAEKGAVSLADQNVVTRRDAVGRNNRIAMNHNERFWGAFVTEVQEWITAAAKGEHSGSSSWDGYAAACVCDAGVKALTDDGVVPVQMIAKPEFYV